MKKVSSIFLALIMIISITVPTFATTSQFEPSDGLGMSVTLEKTESIDEGVAPRALLRTSYFDGVSVYAAKAGYGYLAESVNTFYPAKSPIVSFPINSTFYNYYWGYECDRLYFAGAATIGGASRVEVYAGGTLIDSYYGLNTNSYYTLNFVEASDNVARTSTPHIRIVCYDSNGNWILQGNVSGL